MNTGEAITHKEGQIHTRRRNIYKEANTEILRLGEGGVGNGEDGGI